MVMMRKKKNKISSLCRSDGSVTEDKEEMGIMTKEFFGALYSSKGVEDVGTLLDAVPQKVTSEMNDKLKKLYTGNEVKKALFQIFHTKAPGPDGFPTHFFQKHYSFCWEEVTQMC